MGDSPAADDSTADSPAADSVRTRLSRSLTRRRLLLAGGAALGAVGVSRLRTEPPTSIQTPDGTWPFTDRDSARTSAAQAAAPPTAPTISWQKRPVSSVDSLVVGPEHVYVGSRRSDAQAPQVAALVRDDGTVQWTAQAPGIRLAYAGGAVYATGTSETGNSAEEREPPFGSVVRLDASTGERMWRHPLRDRGERLLVTRQTVYVGSQYGLDALERDGGRCMFRAQTGGGPTTPLLVDGSLVLTGSRVGRYGARRWSDLVLKRLPSPVWTRNPTSLTLDPAVIEDAGTASSLVATGTLGTYNDAAQMIRTHAVPDGSRRWDAVNAGPLSDPTVVKELCAAGPRLFHGLRTGSDAQRQRSLVCRDATTGAEQWRASFPNWLRSVVVAGDRVLAGTRLDAVTPAGSNGSEQSGSNNGRPPPGRIAAFTLDGTVRWRVPIPGSVAHVVPVSNRVFVGTDDASYGGRTANSGHVIAVD
ncbi:MAG: PQQ-binding-like beta-propeller repeat protein [Halobellus sp.]|uniref:outer membrane protein assembly factor BamB family protein n=1 Tax=Halobellus sp. TaxID=1979212 RepID=UPI0035D4269E